VIRDDERDGASGSPSQRAATATMLRMVAVIDAVAGAGMVVVGLTTDTMVWVWIGLALMAGAVFVWRVPRGSPTRPRWTVSPRPAGSCRHIPRAPPAFTG